MTESRKNPPNNDRGSPDPASVPGPVGQDIHYSLRVFWLSYNLMKSVLLALLAMGLFSAAGVTEAADRTDAAHVIVPLADNEHQYIAPVAKDLGNGRNLATNLYWGAAYGLKTFLRKSSKFAFTGCKKIDDQILERCEFKHLKSNSVVVLEAYAGDRLKQSLNRFFDLAGGNTQTLGLEKHYDPSLVIYSGHNGLMDYPWKIFGGIAVKKAKKIAILACQSQFYFKPSFSSTGIRPVIVTKSNMAPEGYLLEGLLDGYFSGRPADEIKLEMAKAYAKYQKISVKAASGIFDTKF